MDQVGSLTAQPVVVPPGTLAERRLGRYSLIDNLSLHVRYEHWQLALRCPLVLWCDCLGRYLLHERPGLSREPSLERGAMLLLVVFKQLLAHDPVEVRVRLAVFVHEGLGRHRILAISHRYYLTLGSYLVPVHLVKELNSLISLEGDHGVGLATAHVRTVLGVPEHHEVSFLIQLLKTIVFNDGSVDELG